MPLLMTEEEKKTKIVHSFRLLVVVTDVVEVEVVNVVVGGKVAVVTTMPVVVRLAFGVVVSRGCSSEKNDLFVSGMQWGCVLTRVVIVRVVGGAVLVEVVLERPGSQMLKFQKVGSVDQRQKREMTSIERSEKRKEKGEEKVLAIDGI